MSPRESMDWNEWKHHVLNELKALRTQGEKQAEAIVDLKLEFMALKIKAGMWGAVLGAMPSLLFKALGK